MTKKSFMHYNLQLFSDPDSSDVDNTENNNIDTNTDNNAEGDKTITQEQLQKRLARQKASFDKKLAKAIDEAGKKAVQDYIDQQDEEQRFKNMDESERLQAQIDKLNEENKALKEKQQFEAMKATARKALSDDGLNVPDEVLTLIVSNSAEETKQNMNALKAWTDSLKAEWEKTRATGTTPSSSNISRSDDVDPFAQLRQKFK